MSISTAIIFGMDLKTYLDQEGQTQQALADAMSACGKKITQGMISQWYLGELEVTAERAVQIEKATKGSVSRHELRPDLWPKGKVA